MFKVLVLQQLNNLTDDRIEYQIRDRISFMRCLGLELEDRIPDAKTVWSFREQLKVLNLVEDLVLLLQMTAAMICLRTFHQSIRVNFMHDMC